MINLLEARNAGFSDEDIFSSIAVKYPKAQTAFDQGFTVDEIVESLNKREAPEAPITPELPKLPEPQKPTLTPQGFTPEAEIPIEPEQRPRGATRSFDEIPFEATPAATTEVPLTAEQAPIGGRTITEQIKTLPKTTVVSATEYGANMFDAAELYVRKSRMPVKQEGKQVVPGPFGAGLEVPVSKPKTIEEMTIEEKRKIVDPTFLTKAGEVLRSSMPEWKEDVAKAHGGKTVEKYSNAVAAQLPLYATLYGLGHIPIVGQIAGIGAMMGIETGGFLQTGKELSEGLSEEQTLDWQLVVDKYAPAYGVASGAVEYAGNMLGALRGTGKGAQEAVVKPMLKKILEEVGGIVGEGVEEFTQTGLMNALMSKAILDMKKTHPNFKPGWQPESKLESGLQGLVVSSVMRGGIKTAQRLKHHTIEGKQYVETPDPEGGAPILKPVPETLETQEEKAPIVSREAPTPEESAAEKAALEALKEEPEIEAEEGVLEVPEAVEVGREKVEKAEDWISTLDPKEVDGTTEIAGRNAIRREVDIAKKEGKEVFTFDIDDFKAINDQYGHDEGDVVLKALGRLSKEHFGDKAKVGRSGGEEFTIVSDTKFSTDDMVNFLNAIPAEIKVGGSPVTVSAGMAIGEITEQSGKKRLHADMLAYEAKQKGKHGLVIVDKSGKKIYIKGKGGTDKAYVQEADVRTVQERARRLLEKPEKLTPDQRSALERTVQTFEEIDRDPSRKTPVDDEVSTPESEKPTGKKGKLATKGLQLADKVPGRGDVDITEGQPEVSAKEPAEVKPSEVTNKELEERLKKLPAPVKTTPPKLAKAPHKPQPKTVVTPKPKIEPKAPPKKSEPFKQPLITKEQVEEEFPKQLQALPKTLRGKLKPNISEFYIVRDKKGNALRTAKFGENEFAHIGISPKGDAVITLSPRLGQDQVAWAISHEIRHFGIPKALKSNPKLYSRFDAIYKMDKNNPFTQELRELYPDVSEDVFREEWALARLAQIDEVDNLSKRDQGIVKAFIKILKDFFADIHAKVKGTSPDINKTLRELVKEMGKERVAKVGKIEEVQKFAKAPPVSQMILAEKLNTTPEIIKEAENSKNASDFIEAVNKTDYRDQHVAPSFDDTPYDKRMEEGGDFSLVEVLKGKHNQPGDYFDPRVGARYYGYDNAVGKQSLVAINRAKSDNAIIAYRTIPNDIKQEKLEDGNWITFSKQYAVDHGESRFGENDYRIITQKVKPENVWWDGNDINEWGYDTGSTPPRPSKIELRKIWDEVKSSQADDIFFAKVPEETRETRKALISESGAEIIGGKVVLYRGGNVSKQQLEKLRYNDYLSAVKTGNDLSGNAGADSYGKNVIRIEIPISDVKVTNGEVQYVGESQSLKSIKYPQKIYKAYNDVYGSNYTSEEIDKQENVRSVASQGLEGGRDEFDELMNPHEDLSFAKLPGITPEQREKNLEKLMEGSKVVNEDGSPKVMYRGDNRADLLKGVLEIKEEDEGGSGALFFTDNPEIASGYSVGKQFVPDEAWNTGLHTYVKVLGKETAFLSSENRLSQKAKNKLKQAVLSVSPNYDVDVGWDLSGKDSMVSEETWNYRLLRNKNKVVNNVFDILVESGIVDNEEFPLFLEKSKAFDGVRYESQYEARPGLTPVYLAVKNPIDALNPSDDFLKKYKGDDITIQTLRKNKSSKKENKDTIVFVDKSFREKALALGYDGIVDEGGRITKSTPHSVVIAFRPNQIKSATGNIGKYSAEEEDIRFAKLPPDPAQLKASEVEKKFMAYHARQLERAERSVRAKLIHAPQEWIKERAGMEADLRTYREAKLDEIRKQIYNYARKIKLAGMNWNRVDTALKNVKSVNGLLKTLDYMDTVVQKRVNRQLVTLVETRLQKEKEYFKKVRSGKIKDRYGPEINAKVEAYINELTAEPEAKLKEAEELLKTFEDDPRKDMPGSVEQSLKLVGRQSIKVMTNGELLKVLDNIKYMRSHEGRLRHEQRQAEFDRKIDDLAYNVAPWIRKGPKEMKITGKMKKMIARQRKKAREKGAISKKAEWYFWANIRAENIIKWLTQYRSPQFKAMTFDKVDKAFTKTKSLFDEFNEAFSKIHKERGIEPAQVMMKPHTTIKLDIIEKDNTTETFEESFTLNEMMFTYAHSQNPNSYRHLVGKINEGGEGLHPDVISEIIDKLPQKHKDAVDEMIDYYDDIVYPKLNKVYRELYGVDLAKELRYFPILKINTDRAENQFVADMLQRYSSKLGGVAKGHLQERVKSAAPFDEMSYFDTILDNMKQVTHYIGMAETIRDVSAVLNHPEIKKAMNERNKVAADQVRDWLKRVAYGRIGEAGGPLASVINGIRLNYVPAVLGGNFISMMKQAASFPIGMEMLENKLSLARGIEKWARNPVTMTREINDMSPFMKYRTDTFQRELEEFADKRFKASVLGVAGLKDVSADYYKQFKEFSMAGIKAIDRFTVNSLWWSRYTEVLNNDLDVEIAIDAANELIRNTQPTGTVVNLPQIFTGNAMERAFTMFRNQPNQNFNRMFELGARVGERKVTETLYKWFWRSALPAAVFYTMCRAWRMPYDDPEGYALELMRQMIGGLPIFGDVALGFADWGLTSVAKKRGIKKRTNPFAAKMSSPAIGVFEDAMRITQSKNTKQALTRVSEVAGKFKGAPVVFVKRTIKGVPKALETKDIRYAFYSKYEIEAPTLESSMAQRLTKPSGWRDRVVFDKWYKKQSPKERTKFRKYVKESNNLSAGKFYEHLNKIRMQNANQIETFIKQKIRLYKDYGQRKITKEKWKKKTNNLKEQIKEFRRS